MNDDYKIIVDKRFTKPCECGNTMTLLDYNLTDGESNWLGYKCHYCGDTDLEEINLDEEFKKFKKLIKEDYLTSDDVSARFGAFVVDGLQEVGFSDDSGLKPQEMKNIVYVPGKVNLPEYYFCTGIKIGFCHKCKTILILKDLMFRSEYDLDGTGKMQDFILITLYCINCDEDIIVKKKFYKGENNGRL
jgi:hypothetical protein